MSQQIKTTCRGCGHGGCGVLIKLDDSGTKIKSIVGDPDNPSSKGYICVKAYAATDMNDHPDRLKFPLLKEGGEWKRVSWDTALELLAQKLKTISEESGPEAVAFVRGTGRHYNHFMERFSNLFGSPNRVSNAHMCYIPRGTVCRILGLKSLPIVDYDSKPACVMVWGANPLVSNPDEYTSINLENSLKANAKLIVVDPRRTRLAERAEIWLQLRPATDLLVALGMMNVIIKEQLYDRDFVGNYCENFDALAKHVSRYTPESVEGLSWVPASTIKKAARLYSASKPAAIHWGVGIEQNVNCIGADTALIYLVALTGNLDAQGGNVVFEPPSIMTYDKFVLKEKFPQERASKRIGGKEYPLLAMADRITPYYLWNAIIKEDPYKIRAVICAGSNLLAAREDAKLVKQVLEKLEFLAVSDQFMTPTAELADLVLPSATWLESNGIADYWKVHGYVFPHVKVLDPPGEAWSDMKIFNELGKCMGFGDYLWDDVDQSLDHILSPSGITWEQFVERGYLRGPVNYGKYRKEGFKTSSGKFDFWPGKFREWGLGPLPDYRENAETPYNDPALAKRYPLVLVTGARSMEYFNSEGRNLSRLRQRHPVPLADIHPETASARKIENGDWIEIETVNGTIKQMARVTDSISPKVISIEHGWWYPEAKNYGWDISNANVLTRCEPVTMGALIGSTSLKGLLCQVRKTEAPELLLTKPGQPKI